MHPVFMGTTTASKTPVVVRRRCRVMVFEKPELVDETGWWAQRRRTSHVTGMTDTGDVAGWLRAATEVFLFPPDLQQKIFQIQQKSPKIEKKVIWYILNKNLLYYCIFNPNVILPPLQLLRS